MTYLIFGATGGIGSVCCTELQAHGHRVLASGRDPQKLAILASDLGTAPLLDENTPAARAKQSTLQERTS